VAEGSAGAAAAGDAGSGGVASAEDAAAGGGAPDPAAPTRFVLLRHGETALTGEKRFSGSGGSDPDLSALGREQAERAARELAEHGGGIDAVVSSPLARCRQTAAVAAARLGLDVTVEPGLRETDFGVWDGLTFADVQAQHGESMAAWLGSATAAPPGGESFAAVGERVARTRDALLDAHRGRTLLLVSHVTPIKCLVQLALGAPFEALFRMYLAPAALCEVAYYPDGNASVRYVNATAHLR
jgi:probable phosphoglycerate mutase